MAPEVDVEIPVRVRAKGRAEAVEALKRVLTPTPAELELAVLLLVRWAGPGFTGAIEIHAKDGEFQTLNHPNRLTREGLDAMVKGAK